MKTQLKQVGYNILGSFAHKLPVGKKEFSNFCEKIFLMYNLPDLPSYRHAIATMVMHLGPQEVKKPLKYFALSVRASMAKQLAYDVMQDIKEEETKKAAEKKAKEEAESNIKPEGSDVKERPQETPEQVV